MRVPANVICEKVNALHEFNPMLGHRRCRLGITYPEIMIPLVGNVKELKLQRDLVERTVEGVLKENRLTKKEIPYMIGTMIEVPRAAVTADEIA